MSSIVLKGPVLAGCRNRSQMFRFIRHTDLQHYCRRKILTKKSRIWQIKLVFVDFVFLLSIYCTVFPSCHPAVIFWLYFDCYFKREQLIFKLFLFEIARYVWRWRHLSTNFSSSEIVKEIWNCRLNTMIILVLKWKLTPSERIPIALCQYLLENRHIMLMSWNRNCIGNVFKVS